MFDPKVHVGVAAFIQSDLRLLMLQRADDATHGASQWSVPGGWLEFGEAPEDAVVREVKEETDLETYSSIRPRILDVVTNTHPDPIGHVACIIFEMGVYGNMKNMEPTKAQRLEWVDAHRVREMWRADKLFAPLATFLDRRGGF